MMEQIGPLSCHLTPTSIVKLATYEVTMKRPLECPSIIQIPHIQPTVFISTDSCCGDRKPLSSTLITETFEESYDCDDDITVTSSKKHTDVQDHGSSYLRPAKKKRSKSYYTITEDIYETKTYSNASKRPKKKSRQEKSKSQPHGKKPASKKALKHNFQRNDSHEFSTITDTYYETKTHSGKHPKTQVIKGDKQIKEKSNIGGKFSGLLKGLVKSPSTPSMIAPSE